ncbi:MAG: helix-turn-helix transcriptional regulator [Clostridia bacterium]|nr:helix-turn-helix transcriptional regulator [Clostridia bacterium]
MVLYETAGKGTLTAILKNKLSCLPHLHSRIEAGLIIKGSSNMFIHGKKYTVKEGDAFFVPPNTIHSYEDKEEVWAHLLICPPEDIAPLFGETAAYNTACPVIHLEDLDFAKQLFLRMEALVQSTEPTASQGAISYAAAIISELLLHADAEPPEKEKDLTAAQKILAFCDMNYKRNINLDTLSEELGYSKYYISRVFSGDIKTSFTDYLRGLRIHAARRLLRSTNMSVTDIAYEVGYVCVRTFNRQFSQITGLSPTEYAKEKRQTTKQKNSK